MIKVVSLWMMPAECGFRSTGWVHFSLPMGFLKLAQQSTTCLKWIKCVQIIHFCPEFRLVTLAQCLLAPKLLVRIGTCRLGTCTSPTVRVRIFDVSVVTNAVVQCCVITLVMGHTTPAENIKKIKLKNEFLRIDSVHRTASTPNSTPEKRIYHPAYNSLM